MTSGHAVAEAGTVRRHRTNFISHLSQQCHSFSHATLIASICALITYICVWQVSHLPAEIFCVKNTVLQHTQQLSLMAVGQLIAQMDYASGRVSQGLRIFRQERSGVT